jgi:hypothetical protein
LGAGNHVLLKPVSIERDLGAVVELATGVSTNDRVIENPPDGITSGAEVRIAGATPAVADAGKTTTRSAKGGNEKG